VIALLCGAAWAGTLAGAVQETGTAAPVLDAAVYAVDGSFELWAVQVDAGGRYRIDDLPAGAYRLWVVPGSTSDRVSRVWPAARDFCDGERVYVDADESVDDLDFALEAGGSLSGRLLEPSGTAASGATVSATGGDGQSTAMSRSSTTDQDGRFTVLGLDGTVGTTDDWTLEVDGAGLPTQFLANGGGTYEEVDADSFGVALGADTDAGEATLLAGISVSGWVLGPDGDGLPGATVHVYSSSQVVSVSGGDDGSFAASGLPPGSVLPWASVDGYATTYWPDWDRPTEWLETTTEGEALVDVELLLPPEATVQFQLVDADGLDVDWSGASVLLYNDTYTVGKGDGVDEDGLVELTALHGGTWFLYVFAATEGYSDGWVEEEGALDGEAAAFSLQGEVDNGTFQVVLERGASQAGTITDDTGAPIAGAIVVATNDLGDTLRAYTDADGNYLMTGIPSDAWTFQAGYQGACDVDGGFVTAWLPGTFDPGAGEPITLASGDVLTGGDLVLPIDLDLDEMGDAWEDANGLDATVDDAELDPDDDGVSNLWEFRWGTDPQDARDGEGRCGCGQSGSAALLWLAPLPFAWGLRRRRR
jgi:Carboxypeptidase regulatory-like domain